VQVRANAGGNQGEKDSHRGSVQTEKIHRTFQKAERDRRAGDVQQNRIARMRNRDPVADGGRGNLLPGNQDLKQVMSINLVRQPQMLHGVGQDLLPVRALDAVVNTAGFQRLAELRKRLFIGQGLSESVR
jgi:hypothetical protein